MKNNHGLRQDWHIAKVCVLFTLTFAALTARATTPTNYWDPQEVGAGTNGSDGSGTWDSGTTWWNGTNHVAWTVNDVAYIGSGTPGTYNITLNNGVSAAITSVNSSGYTFSGASLTNTNNLVLSANVSATFNNHLYLSSGVGLTIGNGATLNLTGGLNSLGGNPTLNGNTTGILAIQSGTVAIPGEVIMHANINQTGGAFTSAQFFIGYGGPGNWTMSGGTANISSGLYVSRASTGILNISGGTMATPSGANMFMSTVDASDNGTVNLSGGNLNIGIGIAGTPGLTSTSLGTLYFMVAGTGFAYSASAQAIFNMSSGTLAAKGFQFGSTNAISYASNPKCQFNLTGGTVYLDSLGISNASTATNLFTSMVLNLSGGTIAATTNWVGRLPMNLTTTNGNVTFQAGDVSGNPHNITLTNALSGSGGLNVSGNGILTLSGVDTFAGSSSVYSGTLAVSTVGSPNIGPVSVSGSATLSTVLATAGQSWTTAGLTLNPNATAGFNLGGASLSASQPMIQVNGNLQLDASDTISFQNTTLALGTYPLIGFSGSFNLTGGTNSPAITSTQGGVVAGLSQNGNVIDLTVSGFITTEPPAILYVPQGSNGIISVTTTGSGLSYQWYGVSQGQLSDGANFSGSATSSLTILNAQDANADTYSVVVSGPAGSFVQSSSTIVLIADTNTGPFASDNWPGSIPYGSGSGVQVHYCILDPNASFNTPGNWIGSLGLAPNSGDQTYSAQVTLDGLFGDQVNNQSGFLNVVDTSFAYWTNVPVIDVLMQVYGTSSVYTANPIAALEGEIAPANTLRSVNIGVPLGADNQQWNWMLLSITNSVDGHGIRTVGDNSVTSSAGEYGGVNNGTVRFQSCNGWAVRAIAWGPQGAFGTSNQVNQFAAAPVCPPAPNNNLAYVDFNEGQTNDLEVISNPGQGYGYTQQSGIGPAGDLRTAIQSTGAVMNFGILSNYLGYPCDQPLNMELGIEFYDDPGLAGTIISPYQYATDEQGDLATYAGLTYTTLGTGKWLKLGFTIPSVDLEGVSTSPLTGGPTLEFSGNGPWIDRVELGVYETGTNALAGQTPDQAYQQDPLVGQTNYGYYAEWNPSAGIIDNLDTAGYAVSYAGPTNDQLICEVPQFISAGNNRIQFGLSNSVFGAYTQGNVDMVMTLTYYDDPALTGATFALSEYFTWLIGNSNPNNAVLPIAPYSAATVLHGTGKWLNATFELPNLSLLGVYGGTAGDAVVIWAASTNVRVSAAQFNVIRPAGPFEGIDYLQNLAATTAATNLSLVWRGTADVQATTNLLRPWSDIIAITNTLLNNTYMPPISMATPAEYFRLSVPPYPAYLGLPYAEGLIQNGDFLANAMTFTNWPGYLGSPNPSAITGWTSSTAGQGINGAGVNIASGSPFGPYGASQYTYAFIQNPGNLTQNLSLAASTTYQLSFDAAGRSSDSGVVFQVQIGDNSQVYLTTGNINAGNDGFTQYTYTFTTPASFSGTPTIQLQNVSASGSGVTVDFADVSLTP